MEEITNNENPKVDTTKVNRNLSNWGWWISGIYIAIIIVLSIICFKNTGELKINELGDFLAGLFAPLAFLWLVLGFYQQGTELKQNTEALRLQVQELQNSVEQQEKMANIATQQYNSDLELKELQTQDYKNRMGPNFKIIRQDQKAGIRSVDYSFTVLNDGDTIYNVSIDSDPKTKFNINGFIQTWATGQAMRFKSTENTMLRFPEARSDLILLFSFKTAKSEDDSASLLIKF